MSVSEAHVCYEDLSSSLTLRREILENMQHKFPNYPNRDDMLWPSVDQVELNVQDSDSDGSFPQMDLRKIIQ